MTTKTELRFHVTLDTEIDIWARWRSQPIT